MIFSSAWTDPNTHPEDKKRISETLGYWAWRLGPICESALANFYFICSDRVGTEKETTFMGSSCFIQLRPTMRVMENLGVKQQAILRRKVDL